MPERCDPKTSQRKLIHYLETQSKAITCLAPKKSRQLSGKDVHELRVATRRARATFWILRHSSAHIRFEELDNDLRKLGKALGHVRELDVAILDANRFGIDATKLIARQKIFQMKLQKRINRNQQNHLSTQLSAAENAAHAMSPIFLGEARDTLRARLNRQLDRHLHGQTKLHQLRIMMKKARYVLEALGRPVSPMKSLQDLLGDAHDLEFLQTLIGKNATIKAEQRSLNDKAIRVAKSALRFAVSQLGNKYESRCF